MNILKKKGFRVFLWGAIFSGVVVWLANMFWIQNISLLFQILFVIPGTIGAIFAMTILNPICKRSKTPDVCFGGMLDGGRYDWFIHMWMYLAISLFYGLVFFLVYRFIKYLKNRKSKYVSSHY